MWFLFPFIFYVTSISTPEMSGFLRSVVPTCMQVKDKLLIFYSSVIFSNAFIFMLFNVSLNICLY